MTALDTKYYTRYTQNYYQLVAQLAESGWNCVPSWLCLEAVIKPAWNLPVPNVQYKTPGDGQRRCPKHV